VAGPTITLQWQPAAGGGFTTLSDGMSAGLGDLRTRANLIHLAAATFGTGDTVRAVSNGAAVDAEVYVLVLPTTWIVG